MRATWKGSFTFGLVNIPVEVHTAVREDRIGFKMLHKDCGGSIKFERVCEKHPDAGALPWEQITKGYEHKKGEYVVMDETDFEAAKVASSKTIEIDSFVPIRNIDPRFFEKPHFLLPQQGAERGYALIRAALAKTGTVGIGQVAMRQNSQSIVGIQAMGDALVLHTMRFSEELVNINAFKFPGDELIRPQELTMAEQLITSMQDAFNPDTYANEHREALLEIISDKLGGKPIAKRTDDAPVPQPIMDLLATLQASIHAPKRKRKTA
jgi:DNA end-binding protein Ku